MLLTPCPTRGCNGLAILSSKTEGGVLSHSAFCTTCGETHPVAQDEVDTAKDNQRGLDALKAVDH